MPNYTKLFNSIITSTIWSEDDKTRIIWITMLAIADQNGEVHGSIPGLARIAGVSIQDTEAAINKFLEPDPYSRTPEFDSRRICKIDGGWELLNHAKYRRMASLADQKDANIKRQKRHRDRTPLVTHERDSNAFVTVKTYKAEAEAEAEVKTEENINVERERESTKNKTRSLATAAPLVSKINEINPAWAAMPLLSAKESVVYYVNQESLNAATDEAWEALKAYYKAKLPEGKPSYRPKSREKLIADFPDVITYAIQWQENRPKPVIKKQEPEIVGEPMTAEEIAEMFKSSKSL